MKRVCDIGEFGLIRRLQRQLGNRWIGDDCAVLPAGDPRMRLLLTCDPVIEQVHFTADTPPYRVGWKAMARNLSDIAAMGGRPRWALVSVGLRPSTTVAYVQHLYRGLQAVAKRFGCVIAGGDTAHVQHQQFVVVTVLGEVQISCLVRRTGAQAGDAVFVTGQLGGSLLGRHLTFTPRLREAQWLTQHFRPHAMIDVSDGLASDLQRLVEAGGLGFDIVSSSIPIAPAAYRLLGAAMRSRQPQQVQAAALQHALTDGEDFELLFTISRRAAARLKAQWPFRLPLTEIGRVIRRPVVLLDGKPLRLSGYDHFQS